MADSQKRLQTASNDYFAQERRNISSAPASGQGQAAMSMQNPQPPSSDKPVTTGNPRRLRGGARGGSDNNATGQIHLNADNVNHGASVVTDAPAGSSVNEALRGMRIGSTLENDVAPVANARLERLSQPKHHPIHAHNNSSNNSITNNTNTSHAGQSHSQHGNGSHHQLLLNHSSHNSGTNIDGNTTFITSTESTGHHHASLPTTTITTTAATVVAAVSK